MEPVSWTDQPEMEVDADKYCDSHRGAGYLLSDIQALGSDQHMNKNGIGLDEDLDQLFKSAIEQLAAGKAFNETIEGLINLPGGNWRIAFYRTDLHGYGLAIRPLPKEIPTLEDIMPSPLSELTGVIQELMGRPKGLILVTGSTGSGKSTTLAAMINYLNQHFRKKVITLEDPVEYRHISNQCVIHHRQVGVDVKDYSTGLRDVLRQDPDVILLGELRDLDTISQAMTAAETGHLVIATLHSRNFASTITRIIDVFPSNQQPMIRAQLSSSLLGVISQTLLPSTGFANGKSRVLHPEIVVLNKGAGGVRATINEARYHQIEQTLEAQNKADGAAYYGFDTTYKMLKQKSYVE